MRVAIRTSSKVGRLNAQAFQWTSTELLGWVMGAFIKLQVLSSRSIWDLSAALDSFDMPHTVVKLGGGLL